MNSLEAELLFKITIKFQEKYEIPLRLTGNLYLEENKKIAEIKGINAEPNKRFELSARDDYSGGENKIIFLAYSPISQRGLNFIQEFRDSNPRGDVDFLLHLFVDVLSSKVLISNLIIMENVNSPIEIEGSTVNAKPVYYARKSGLSRSFVDSWFLSGENGSAFLEFRAENLKKNIIVSSSNWIHDFCPVFDLGRYFIYECPLPEIEEGSGSAAERLKAAIDAAKEMRDYLIKCEWNAVIEKSRSIWELLRNQDEIKDLLVSDGYTEEAFEDINHSLRRLFDFSSKFHHRQDRDRRIMPEIKASKEDADLVYTLAVGIINLVSKKISRLSK